MSSFHITPVTHLFSKLNSDHLTLSPHKTSTISCKDSPYWTTLDSNIKTYLKKAIPMKEPLCVYEPMHYFTFTAPQPYTAAPALCVATCELIGGSRQQAMAAAAALHLVIAASNTHDQLISNKSPEPESAVQNKYAPNVKLLIPDCMVPFGLELLSGSDDPGLNNSNRVLRAIIEITRTVGSQGTIHGQYSEFLLTEEGEGEGSCDVALFEKVAEKEGMLHACGAACGAILGGGSDVEIETLRKFGFYYGKARGMLKGNIDSKKEYLMGEMSNLAFQELKDFKGDNIEEIVSLLILRKSYA